MSQTILVADDEPEIVEILKIYLEKESYQVLAASSGKGVLAALNERDVDLIVMDIMMPDMDGLQAVKEIRRSRQTPVIFLTARVQDHEKILGLGLGADDYITKPFNPLEVVARVQAQLRRTYWGAGNVDGESPRKNTIKAGDLTLDIDTCTVERAGNVIALTSIEFRLLKHFMEHSGRVFTKKQLYEAVWGEIYAADDNTVMVCISKLRDKIETGADPYIVTIRGLGYKFAKRTAPV